MIDLAADPFDLFAIWMTQAEASELNDPNAMTLATTTKDGRPSARIVLLKSWDRLGFVFYTNLESRKSDEIAVNPHVALLFHWKSRKRQIRIEGIAAQVSDAEADAYFETRPRLSRIGAWASDQSRPLPDRRLLEQRLEQEIAKYADAPVPRPPHWSGWCVTPEAIEFWEDRDFRLHDRAVFISTSTGWTASRLYP
ncbi:pyridoxamine 5'-phosphate oxidase [Acidiphilium sp. AL]|uniref:Pyridoxine/pyridoxamine 5'-phosphate oxidase n=2 Tax=Acidocellaceae TaxID=3385905 RepID=A0ABS9DZB6_9PROT|nr:pyridoxamine 5'-phosphate oxidase [Acidiphilium iwatense]MCU4161869.1 pyridoxamine 5'-phosphate oxidase [Acidiphilium sp. AL]